MTQIASTNNCLIYQSGAFLFLFSACLFFFGNQSVAFEKAPANIVENEKNTSVYFNDKKVGLLNEEVKNLDSFDESKSLFILDTFDVFAKTVTIKSNATVTKTGTKDKLFRFFDRVFDVTLETHDDYAVISVRNTIGVSFYQIYIRKNEQNELEIFKETAWDSITTLVEIGVDDVEPKRADLICQREAIKVINDIIYVPDLLNLNEENKQDCHIDINSDM